MILTILRRDYPNDPVFTIPDVLSIRSDGETLICEHQYPIGSTLVIMRLPVPLRSVAELQLRE